MHSFAYIVCRTYNGEMTPTVHLCCLSFLKLHSSQSKGEGEKNHILILTLLQLVPPLKLQCQFRFWSFKNTYSLVSASVATASLRLLELIG